MQPTHFRAYAKTTAVSRRNLDQGDGTVHRATVEHDTHDPVVEGKTKEGRASFSSKVPIDHIAFYGGTIAEAVCLGQLDGPFPAGKITADFKDIPEEPPLLEQDTVTEAQGFRKIG